jgi:hypothetical protein
MRRQAMEDWSNKKWKVEGRRQQVLMMRIILRQGGEELEAAEPRII